MVATCALNGGGCCAVVRCTALRCHAAGIYVLNPGWLEMCNSKKKFVQEKRHWLSTPRQEHTHDTNLDHTAGLAGKWHAVREQTNAKVSETSSIGGRNKRYSWSFLLPFPFFLLYLRLINKVTVGTFNPGFCKLESRLVCGGPDGLHLQIVAGGRRGPVCGTNREEDAAIYLCRRLAKRERNAANWMGARYVGVHTGLLCLNVATVMLMYFRQCHPLLHSLSLPRRQLRLSFYFDM